MGSWAKNDVDENTTMFFPHSFCFKDFSQIPIHFFKPQIRFPAAAVQSFYVVCICRHLQRIILADTFRGENKHAVFFLALLCCSWSIHWRKYLSTYYFYYTIHFLKEIFASSRHSFLCPAFCLFFLLSEIRVAFS